MGAGGLHCGQKGDNLYAQIEKCVFTIYSTYFLVRRLQHIWSLQLDLVSLISSNISCQYSSFDSERGLRREIGDPLFAGAGRI